MTDLARWEALAREPVSPWAERLRLLADRCMYDDVVIDVGAGGMWLRGMIAPTCLYLPVDCVEGAVIRFDFDYRDCDASAPPLRGDVVVVSGVLEYVSPPRDLIWTANLWAPRLLLSYAVPVEGEDRAAAGWVNALELDDLYALLRGFYSQIETIGWWRGQVLIEARE